MRTAKERRQWWSVGRSDFLIARVVTIAVVVLGPLFALWGRLSDWVAGRPLTWISWEDRGPEFAGSSTDAGVRAHHSGELVWEQTGAGVGRWFVSLLPDLVTGAVIAVSALLVLRLIKRIESGEPFDTSSVWYVRVLGLMTFCYGMFMPLLVLIIGVVLTFGVQDEPAYGFQFDGSDFLPIAVGLVLLVVAEVWRRGKEIADDVEGLV